MSPYKFLPHMADSAISAAGESREELLNSALEGMFELASPRNLKKKENVEREFSVNGNDFTEIFINTLSEALTQSDINKEAYKKIKFNKLTDREASGTFFGNSVESFELVIKGVTYHGLKIESPKPNQWKATLIFDV